MVDELKSFLADLKGFRRDLKTEKVDRVAKKALRERAEQLGSRWFSEVSPLLTSSAGFAAETVEKYSGNCARLIKLSAPNNLKRSYLSALDELIKPFRDELILPAQQGLAGGAGDKSQFNTFFSDVADKEENEYLTEALDCAKAGYLKAAAVLGWCAAIDRIQRRIEKEGFPKFNVTSANLASQTKGRFKKFNKTQSVNSISELRMVFDTDILWIIEGMGWIDANQHTRLRSCFDMRNHSAHPGEAPVTEYNLMSFFSDIDKIVLGNPQFDI